MPQHVSIRAPAKLNLALAVGPPGSDGLHPVASWMVTIDLVDDLTITRAADDRSSSHAILWHDEARRRSDINWSTRDDLAVRAHLTLEKHVGRRLPVRLRLEKRIPVGGGLGGGSSDAAAMLNGVNELFELGLSTDDLIALAATLGSDVPFFVAGGSAIVEAVGGRIEQHASSPELYAVVAFPESPCSTRAVYKAFDAIESRGLRAERVRALAEHGRPTAENVFNDLTEAALRVEPALADALDRISRVAERPAAIAGSGSTIYVVCDDSLHAEALVKAIEADCGLPSLAVRTM